LLYGGLNWFSNDKPIYILGISTTEKLSATLVVDCRLWLANVWCWLWAGVLISLSFLQHLSVRVTLARLMSQAVSSCSLYFLGACMRLNCSFLPCLIEREWNPLGLRFPL
jgi:hypothetical protein